MIDYATFGVHDLATSAKFYDATLGALGFKRAHEYPTTVGYAHPSGQTVWILSPHDQKEARAGNGSMVGFGASTRAQVRDFHAAALANGGSCEGAPGLREDYGPNMYLAYVRDPVGNKMSAICKATSE